MNVVDGFSVFKMLLKGKKAERLSDFVWFSTRVLFASLKGKGCESFEKKE